MEKLHVRLLNEGTDVWAVVPAQHVTKNTHVILENSIEADQDCELEFKPGSRVATIMRKDAQGMSFMTAERIHAE